MSDETPEIEPEEQPKRRRRRRRGGRADASEVKSSSDATAANASEEDVTSEIEPAAEDIEAEEAASDVMLEADEEAEEPDPEDEAEEEDAEREEEPEAEEDLEAEDDEDDEDEDEDEDEEPESEGKRSRFRRRRGGAGSEEPAAPPKPAPTRRRRSQRDPNLPPPVVRAQAKYVRSSPRKARLVCDHIRGKSVDEARAILAHTPRAIARDWSKLLESAVANAEHNHELVGEDLYVKAIHADDGPTIKRFRPRAMGRATKIRKRTSHLTILLTPKD
jgi:ribosomal protein L22